MISGKRLAGAILSVSGIAILCTLGSWQVQRLQWKNDIITRLDTARAQPQILQFTDLQVPNTTILPLAYGSVSGQLLSDKEILVGPKPADDDSGAIGYHLVTPLKMTGGTVLVDRGWVPEDFRDPAQRRHLSAPPSVTVTFTGIARRPDYNRFTSGNNPAGDQWFHTDTAQIAAAKHLGPTAPLVLYAERANRKFDAQTMNPPDWAPRNKHLQYAIFWFTMAAVLAGFYIFVLTRRSKPTP